MSSLNIKNLSVENAKMINFNADTHNISLKRDGTLIYFIDGKLFSPRCERTERFKHIANILSACNFPNCMGEMFLDEKNACVFDVSKKENWDKCKFMIFDLIDSKNNKEIYEMPFVERNKLLNKLVNDLDNHFISKIITFKNFKEGWDYVLENKSEGLVIRDNHSWFKIKFLYEEKVEIVNHEGKIEKGTFILKDGNRISGTSSQFVIKYLSIAGKGKKPIAEVEYQFKTNDNKMFQPRLRQIVEK